MTIDFLRFFVWRPTATQRAYDQNLYVVSRLRNPWEARQSAAKHRFEH